jgi:hypothetical protein
MCVNTPILDTLHLPLPRFLKQPPQLPVNDLEMAERTDLVPDHADALLTLADALEARGLPGGATLARSGAVKLFQAKGNLAAAVNVGRAR